MINNLTIKNIYLTILKIFVVVMIVAETNKKTTYIIWGTVIVLLLLYFLFEFIMKKKKTISTKHFLIWFSMFLIVGIDILFSEYSSIKTVQFTMQLFVLFLCCKNYDNESSSNSNVDWFYVIMSLYLLLNIYNSYLNNNFLTFINFADKNYTSILIYLYFLYCLSKKYKIGIVISLMFLIVNDSRLYILMLVVSFLCILYYKYFLKNDKIIYYKSKCVFKIFLSFLVISFALSFFWVNFIVGDNTKNYKESLNDTSNAIRMNSNLYFFKIIAQDKNLIWRGYDSDIIVALGLSSDDAVNSSKYGGYRIVQPHNSFINPFLTHGLIYTIIYFIILSYLLGNLINNKNIHIWLPYFIGCIFMHTLLSSIYLIFLTIILVESNKRSENL